MNRHGEKLELYQIEELRLNAFKRNVAIVAHTVCRLHLDKTQFLKMRFHHRFFAGPTPEKREAAYLKKHHKDTPAHVENAINVEETQQAELKLNQAMESLKAQPDKY